MVCNDSTYEGIDFCLKVSVAITSCGRDESPSCQVDKEDLKHQFTAYPSEIHISVELYSTFDVASSEM